VPKVLKFYERYRDGRAVPEPVSYRRVASAPAKSRAHAKPVVMYLSNAPSQ
jgi:hypothetical protein